MAARALPPGAVRRRALFGLLDADGWTAATLKGLFWFVAIIFLLGYLPDRAYYFTVFPTIDLGANVISPVNFCPAHNKNLPCPAPNGAVVPWEPSPRQLDLPDPRSGAATVLSGTTMYLAGGTKNGASSAEVLQAPVSTDGNFGAWQRSQPLPAPRSGASVVTLSGIPYVIGGLDENGQPSNTVFAGVVKDGNLTAWEARQGNKGDLTLPKPLAGATAVATESGIFLLGGRSSDGPSRNVYRALLDSAISPPALKPWEDVAQLPLPEARTDAAGVAIGNTIYLVGGEGPGGITNSVLRLRIDAKGQPTSDPATGELRGWATSGGNQSLPAPRTLATAFSANDVLYVVGGRDETGKPTASMYWAVPEGTAGDLQEWKQLDQTNLREGRAGAPAAVVGSFVFLVGGEGPNGPVPGSLRARIAPEAPFFRLGLFGATIPALSIKGEIGQQLGYLNAAAVGTVDFILLILIGLAHSHPAGARRVLQRLSRGRYRAPREREYSL